MAKVRLVVTDAATGDHFRMSTRLTPDKVILTRSESVSNAHEKTMPLAEWEALQEELGLRPANANNSLLIYFILDDEDRNADGRIAELLEKLAAAEKRHDDTVAELGNALDEARGQKPDGPAKVGLSDDETEMLSERDALITLLMPYVESEEDTPVSVLSRLTGILREKDIEVKPAVLDGADGTSSEQVERIEALAKVIYDEMRKTDPEGKDRPWVEGGNSLKQSEARREAVRRLESAPEKNETPPSENDSGFAPADAAEAIATGKTPGAPVVATHKEPEKPVPVELDKDAFKAALPTDLAELRGIAAPLGVPNYAGMNVAQLRNAITRAEIARHATLPAGPPKNIARPDGEQPAA